MALLKFNKSNVPSSKRGEPTIRIHRKSAISISKYAVEMMELTDQDSVSLLQDDETGDWYLMKDGEDAFQLRMGGGENTSLSFNSTALSNLILDSASLEGDSYKFKIAKEPIEVEGEGLAWCIIMASATS